MLTFEDDIPAPTLPPLALRTAETIRAEATGSIGAGVLSREPVHDLDVEKQGPSTGRVRV
jgi:hypothetical protein